VRHTARGDAAAGSMWDDPRVARGDHVGAFVALSIEVDDVDPQSASLARFLEALGPLADARASGLDD
jgi:hypothetical protein